VNRNLYKKSRGGEKQETPPTYSRCRETEHKQDKIDTEEEGGGSLINRERLTDGEKGILLSGAEQMRGPRDSLTEGADIDIKNPLVTGEKFMENRN